MNWVPPDGPPSAPTTPTPTPEVVHTGPATAPPSGSGWGPPEGSASAPGRRRWVPVAIGIAALVACIVVFVIASDVGSDPADEGSTDPSDPAAIADAGEAIQAEVAELSAFVEEARGLEFLEEVEVELLPDDDFRGRLLEELDEDAEELGATNGVLRALQLIEPDDDLREILPQFLGDAVVGFYDPESGELVVRGSDVTPYVRSTLVHELTHALDDQHFELHRPELEELDDESITAFSALVEGSAVRVEEAWVDQLSREDQRALRAEEAELGASIDVRGVPPVVPQLIGFPYTYGPVFIDALLDDGGQERLDEAFEDPPTTTAQIIDPARFLAGRSPVEVPTPPADGEVVDEGVYGQWALLLTLADKLPGTDATEAGRGWAGDRYVAWSDGEQTCVRSTFVLFTRSDAAALAGALEEWADDHGDAEVEAGDEVTLTACG
jgi:hypothetical protein